MNEALANLIAAAVAFVGTHFALSHPLRGAVVRVVGDKGFQAVYSLVALGTFAWMAMAFRAVPPDTAPLWDGTGHAIWGLATALMLLSSVLLTGSFFGNPALPDPRAAALADPSPVADRRSNRPAHRCDRHAWSASCGGRRAGCWRWFRGRRCP